MPWLAAAAVAAPIVGGLVGNMMAQGDRAKQAKAMKQAMAELEKVGYPPDLSKELIFKEFEKAGILTPQLEEEVHVAASEFEGIKEDTSLRDAQKKALALMQQRAKVGLGAEDRAALNQVRSEVQRDAEAKRQQILQQMQARGMAGSGAELMAQLQAGQAAADTAASQSDSLMAQASQRALEALRSSSDMAGQVRGQDYQVSSDRAAALDERNRFLAQNAVARQSANVNRLNEAQQLNLAEQQRIQDANTNMANQEKLRQTAEEGAYYDRKLGYGQAKANALTGQASHYGNQAAQTAQMYSGMGSAIGSGVSAYGQMQNSNEQNALNRAAAAKK